MEEEDKADVSFGKVFDISMFADTEALDVNSSENLRSRSLSKSFSFDNEEDKRAFLWLSERNEGRSVAKCSLLLNLRKAKIDDERVIPSARARPRNLFILSKRSGSAGVKSVRRISLETPSSSQPANDWVAWRPCRAFSILRKSAMDMVMDDFEASGLGTSLLKSSFREADDKK